jgi:hypothetical protein
MTAEQFCAGCEYIRRISVWLEPTEYICPAEFDPSDGDCPRREEWKDVERSECEADADA